MKINRFKKIIVLSEFTQMDYPYGLYWCHYVSATQDRWFLVMRNGCDVCLYSHYHKTTPKECVDYMSDKAKEEFLSCLKNNFNVVYLDDFIK